MALHRLKPLLGAFERIDAAIEAAAAAGSCRDEFRRARSRIVEMVCGCAADDGDKAEGLCALLDEAMAESLATLRAVPLEKSALEPGGLVGAVDALMREHPSARVRVLTGDVVRGWRDGVKAEIAMARAKLDALPSIPPPPPHDDTSPAAESDTKAKKIPEEQRRSRKPAVVSSGRRARTAESYAPLSMKTRSDPIVSSSRRVSTAESSAPLPTTRSAPIVVTTGNTKPSANMGAPAVVPAQTKKTPPLIVSSAAEEKKLETTKRKLQERYQEAEDAKRRRTIQVIKPPRPPPGTTGQRQSNAQPAVKARAPASCAAKRVFTKTCSLRMKV